MDKLFTYDKKKLVSELKKVEPEMRETYYKGSRFNASKISTQAIGYISVLFEHMKKKYNPAELTVSNLIEELYRVGMTGEYTYALGIDELDKENETFSHLMGPGGCEGVLYAARLLRYYYYLNEKSRGDQVQWETINYLAKCATTLNPLSETKKKSEPAFEMKEQKFGENNFMEKLKLHLDKYYVGQEELKKQVVAALYLWLFHNQRTTLLMIGSTGSGKNYLIETIKSFAGMPVPVVSYDCSSLTPNGFAGADIRDVFRRVSTEMKGFKYPGSGIEGFADSPYRDRCIVYLDEIDKIINYNHDSNGENVNGTIQQQILSAIAGTEVIAGVNTSKVLFILGGAFPRIDDLDKNKRKSAGFIKEEVAFTSCESIRDQIVAIGGERELVGRIEEIVKLKQLNREEFRAILLDKNIGVLTKAQELYRKVGLEIQVDDDVIEGILDLVEKEGSGARGVKNVVNQFASKKYFYDMKANGYQILHIHAGMLKGEPPIMENRMAEEDDFFRCS